MTTQLEIDLNQYSPIPPKVACCPICGSSLYIEGITAMDQLESGSWVPSGVDFSCVTEPAIDSEDWAEWHKWHYSMPYVDWLPVSNIVLNWLSKPEQSAIVKFFWGDE